jgi:hypothetical protein
VWGIGNSDNKVTSLNSMNYNKLIIESIPNRGFKTAKYILLRKVAKLTTLFTSIDNIFAQLELPYSQRLILCE